METTVTVWTSNKSSHYLTNPKRTEPTATDHHRQKNLHCVNEANRTQGKHNGKNRTSAKDDRSIISFSCVDLLYILL